jgi:hypothetical protein
MARALPMMRAYPPAAGAKATAFALLSPALTGAIAVLGGVSPA